MINQVLVAAWSYLYRLIIVFIVLFSSKTTYFQLLLIPVDCDIVVVGSLCFRSIIVRFSVCHRDTIWIVVQFLGSSECDDHATNTVNGTRQSQERPSIVMRYVCNGFLRRESRKKRGAFFFRMNREQCTTTTIRPTPSIDVSKFHEIFTRCYTIVRFFIFFLQVMMIRGAVDSHRAALDAGDKMYRQAKKIFAYVHIAINERNTKNIKDNRE